MDKFFITLLVFVPVAAGAHALGAAASTVFILSALAIVPLAKYIGESVEELASRTTPAVGGLLSATFGNATELIIGILALNAGLIELVKASITGSIISNLLLVLGLSMFFGGWSRDKQTFNKTAVLAQGSTLFLAIIALVIPAIFVQTASVPGNIVQDLSVTVSAVLLLMYAASLFFSLHTHKHLYIEEVSKQEARWGIVRSTAVLCAATTAVAFMSDLLVGSVEPLVASWGWSQLFVGVIVVAIIGNAAENTSAIMMALKNRMDLSLHIAIGSPTQIALFVAPVLVLAGVFIGQPMNLVFNLFELIAVVLSVLIVNLIVADGESNWLEGLQLLAAYAIIAVAFFFHP